MGNEQPKKTESKPQMQPIDKAQLDCICMKIKEYLKLSMEKKQTEVNNRCKELMLMLKAPQRQREAELYKMNSIQMDVNFVKGLEILIRYADILQSKSMYICSCFGNQQEIKEFMPMIDGLVWSARYANIKCLSEFALLMQNFFGFLDYPSQVIDSASVDIQLKKCFELFPQSTYSPDLNSLALLFCKQGITLQEFNQVGHPFSEDNQQYLQVLAAMNPSQANNPPLERQVINNFPPYQNYHQGQTNPQLANQEVRGSMPYRQNDPSQTRPLNAEQTTLNNQMQSKLNVGNAQNYPYQQQQQHNWQYPQQPLQYQQQGGDIYPTCPQSNPQNIHRMEKIGQGSMPQNPMDNLNNPIQGSDKRSVIERQINVQNNIMPSPFNQPIQLGKDVKVNSFGQNFINSYDDVYKSNGIGNKVDYSYPQHADEQILPQPQQTQVNPTIPTIPDQKEEKKSEMKYPTLKSKQTDFANIHEQKIASLQDNIQRQNEKLAEEQMRLDLQSKLKFLHNDITSQIHSNPEQNNGIQQISSKVVSCSLYLPTVGSSQVGFTNTFENHSEQQTNYLNSQIQIANKNDILAGLTQPNNGKEGRFISTNNPPQQKQGQIQDPRNDFMMSHIMKEINEQRNEGNFNQEDGRFQSHPKYQH